MPRGKSLLMDIFFQSLPVPHKVRFHYHHFLLSIYSKVSCFCTVQLGCADPRCPGS